MLAAALVLLERSKLTAETHHLGIYSIERNREGRRLAHRPQTQENDRYLQSLTRDGFSLCHFLYQHFQEEWTGHFRWGHE